MTIPLIIPVFNQLTYLRNILNWWNWYYPEQPVFILDNNSSYPPLLEYYTILQKEYPKVTIIAYMVNDCKANLRRAIDLNIIGKYTYYAISDPDIMPHPSTPPNFLEVFVDYINKGYHHVGFGLLTEKLPKGLHRRDHIIYDESELLKGREAEEYEGYIGYKTPIDTSFAVYTTNNSGWNAPMNGQDWANSLRIFEAFHLSWHLTEDVNDEMHHYFTTCQYRIIGEPSAGRNNFRPKKYSNE